ncbi:MAG: reverse transcriptase/maturase family protein [Pseudomonadota bacterium]|nr:reverse transcriptase/maturase family protein [Pseudomonadota bacterium]
MKRIGGLWPEVIRFENLYLAYRKARRGKVRSPAVARFTLDLEGELLTLQRELMYGDYRPGPYRLFTIYERKARHIAAAPFRDRVVHHAVMNVIEPPLDRRFIHDSYACRKGRGVHAAVDRYQAWSRRYPYVLKADVRQYFASVDHAILKAKLRRYLKDRELLALLDMIIDTAPVEVGEKDLHYFPGDDLFTPFERPTGIPIGNLTSQFFANLFLNEMDHFVKQALHARAYLRYVDDLVVLGKDKHWLHEVKAAIREHLERDRLRLHPRKAHVSHVARGIDLFGYHVFPTHRRPRSDNGHRFARRFRGWARAYRSGELDWDDFNPRVQSWIGHARHGETLGLREAIFGGTVFSRG